MAQMTAVKLALIARALIKYGMKTAAKAASGLSLVSLAWQVAKAVIRFYNQGFNAATIAKSLKEILGEFAPVSMVEEIIQILKDGDFSSVSYNANQQYVQAAQQFISTIGYNETVYSLNTNNQMFLV